MLRDPRRPRLVAQPANTKATPTANSGTEEEDEEDVDDAMTDDMDLEQASLSVPVTPGADEEL
jgi:hypothetical protein